MIRSLFLSSLLTLLAIPVNAEQVCTKHKDGISELHLVSPATSSLKDPVTVQWDVDQKNLLVHFDVNTSVQHEKKVFGPKDYPFMFDVVEIFIAVNDPKDKNFSYYEFEVTPNKQTFDVKIDVKDGKKKFTEGINVGVEVGVDVTQKTWSASLSIPLENLGWKGDLSFLRGNFYAIIGKSPKRTFWSTFLPKQTKPNFHSPEHFKPLFECK
ncbi:MAG: hypothetical protein IT287_07720 [Bdellovibrionaceae bacterium]|nr:hypothetical protein [Pseudobdellovibrionaceae bacterium]